MSINIEQIKIVINPSIPDSSPVELTNDLIYHPELNIGKKLVLNKLPFFTVSLKYPIDLLQNLYNVSYKKIIKFFFNKQYFESKLISIFKNNPNIPTDAEKEKIYNYNVMVMLHFLFPTVFPGTNNLVTSFNEYIDTKSKNDVLEFPNVVSKMISSRNLYSYLKLGGNTYTITKVVWLNDILNNPTYYELIEKYLSYKTWIQENEKKTKDLVTKNLEKILKKLKLKPTERDSLQITDKFIEAFEENKKKTLEKINNTPANTYRDPDTVSHEENLGKIIDKLKLLQEDKINETEDPNDKTKKIYNIKSITTDNNEAINYLTVAITDINELYQKLKSNSKNTLSGIPSNFSNLLNTLTNDIKNLSILNKIANVYMNSQTTNLNYEKDDNDVQELLKKKYSIFTEYIDSINKFMPPAKIASNKLLQGIIGDYTVNEKKKSLIPGNGEKDVLLFEEIMEKTKEELMYSKKISYFSNPDAAKYLNTGVNIINIGSSNMPTIEIQIGFDLIEGEYSDKNIDKIKCKYRSLYLGQETEEYFSSQSKHDYNSHKLFLSKEQIEQDENKSTENKPPSPKPKNKKGGTNYKITKKRKQNKNRKTRKYRR